MPTGESAGTVFVTIDADASPLIAKFAQAESLSRAAGQRIASGLNSGLSTASGIVDQFGRSVSSGITAPMEQAAPAVQQVTTKVIQLGAAVHGVVPEVAAASGAIRVLEGNMPIRAVERFATSVLGLGPLLQAAFPLVGAIALGEMIFHIAERFTGLSEAEKKAAEEAKQVSAEIRNIGAEINRINAKIFEDMFGKTAADAAKIPELMSQAATLAGRVAVLQMEINRQKTEGGPGRRGGVIDPELLNQLALAHSEQEKIQAQMREANADFLKSEQKDDDDAQRKREENARKAAALAREAAEMAKRQQEAISRAVREGSKIIAEEEKKQAEEVQRDLRTLLSEGSKDAEQIIQQHLEEIRKGAEQADKLARIGIRSAGGKSESANESEKIKAQIAYNAQLAHTAQQKLAYEEQLADIENRSLQIKIDQLTAEVQQDRLAGDTVKAAEDQLALDTAIANQNAKQAQAAGQIAAAARQSSLAGQIESSVGKGPGSILDARNAVVAQTMGHAVDGIAEALGRAVQGGQKLSQIFTQLGKSILGNVVSSIVKIGEQMVLTATIGKSAGSAIAVAEVTSAAAVGAANAAAATAAIPIIGPGLAPGVAAATFAEIMSWASLASYDKGGPITEDQVARIHKGEFILTADQMSGRSPMPALPVGGSVSSPGIAPRAASSSSQSNTFHVHGATDTKEVVRAIARHLKSTYPGYSPYSTA